MIAKDSSFYDEEPVHYCTNCLSLRIKGLANMPDLDFCQDCGGTIIEKTHIEDWEEKYVKRYGFRHLDR